MIRVLLSFGIGIWLGGTAMVTPVDREPPVITLPPSPTPSCPATDLSLDQGLGQAINQASEFEKKRALFELAARADSATLQKHIFDASLIPAFGDRHLALLILFGRLAELDPLSAIALAQLDRISADRTLLKRVWQLWSMNDLDSALRSAAALSNARERDVAAQAIHSMHAYRDQSATQQIATITGIAPDDNNRRLILNRLADESPDAAFANVNEIKSMHEQWATISALGRHLVETRGNRSADFASLLENKDLQDRYLAVVIGRIAENDPHAAITTLSAVVGVERQYELYDKIVAQVARQDSRRAKQLADEIGNPAIRDMAYYRVIQYHASQDPVEAAGWVALISSEDLRRYADGFVKRAHLRSLH
jgi:hypothetical protein